MKFKINFDKNILLKKNLLSKNIYFEIILNYQYFKISILFKKKKKKKNTFIKKIDELKQFLKNEFK